MDEESNGGQRPRVDHRAPAPAQYADTGPESPLAAAERAMRRPAATGLVALLIVLNLVMWAWFVQHQDDQLEMLRSDISQADAVVPTPSTDPTLCWLIGASARAGGHGSALAGQLSASGVLDDCSQSAIRGVDGEGP
ncbi:hypothetical protein [Terrabacter sp. NPDC080008]|uniref:hypothetical protein n=1 Tax=Terrabacter sp. NPDC080008 TaxID=3155176 RepID=UPI00344E8F03